MGINAYVFDGRGAYISYGSIGGGDDASSFGREDAHDAYDNEDGRNVL